MSWQGSLLGRLLWWRLHSFSFKSRLKQLRYFPRQMKHAFFLLKHILESGDLPALFLFPFYKIQLYIFFKLIKLPLFLKETCKFIPDLKVNLKSLVSQNNNLAITPFIKSVTDRLLRPRLDDLGRHHHLSLLAQCFIIRP